LVNKGLIVINWINWKKLYQITADLYQIIANTPQLSIINWCALSIDWHLTCVSCIWRKLTFDAQHIHCNVCQCYLSLTNFTIIFARYLKLKHKESYNKLQEGLEELEFWPLKIQKEKHKSLVNWIIVNQQPFTVVKN